MKHSKSLLSSLLVVGFAAGILAQAAFANDRFEDHHPRRAEVLGRDHNLRHELNEDKGHLGGNYGKLMAGDRRIQRQEQRDAHQNGGYITKREQRHLNREENRLNHRIRRDDRNY